MYCSDTQTLPGIDDSERPCSPTNGNPRRPLVSVPSGAKVADSMVVLS